VCAEETDVPLKFVGYLVSIKKGIRVDAIVCLMGKTRILTHVSFHFKLKMNKQ